MTPELRSYVFSKGIILGVILVVLSYVSYFIDPLLFSSWKVGIGIILLVLIFCIVSSAQVKKIIPFPSFKQAFIAFIVPFIIGYAINTLGSGILWNHIDIEAAEEVNAIIIENQLAGMEQWGAPQENIDEAAASFEEMGPAGQFSWGSQLQGYLWMVVFFSVIGLLVALATRKKDPNAIQ